MAVIPVNDPKNLKGDTKLMNTLRNAVKELADEEGWADLGPVRSRIANAGPFDHRTYGFKKLSDLFAAIDLFEMKKQVNGTQTVAMVRIRKGAERRRRCCRARSDPVRRNPRDGRRRSRTGFGHGAGSSGSELRQSDRRHRGNGILA